MPEVLFDSSRGQSLVHIILQSACAVLSAGFSREDVSDLLRQVVLVGGAADFPGIRPRAEYEMRCLLQHLVGFREGSSSNQLALADVEPMLSTRAWWDWCCELFRSRFHLLPMCFLVIGPRSGLDFMESPEDAAVSRPQQVLRVHRRRLRPSTSPRI